MIRPMTFVTAVMMLGSGAWMFVVKHRAEQLDRRIGDVTAQVRSSEQRIRVLRAEWALETDPNRLQRLATMFMPQLQPMKPDQLVTMQQLADRLPPPGATVPHLPLPPPLPDELPAPGAPAGLVASAAVPQTVAAVMTAGAPTATAGAAAHETPAHETPAPHTVAHTAPQEVSRATAHRSETPRRVAATHRARPETAGAPQPLGASVLAPRHSRTPMGAKVMAITASAPPVPARAVPPPVSAVPRRHGSVFGDLGANLPPPQPLRGSTP